MDLSFNDIAIGAISKDELASFTSTENFYEKNLNKNFTRLDLIKILDKFYQQNQTKQIDRQVISVGLLDYEFNSSNGQLQINCFKNNKLFFSISPIKSKHLDIILDCDFYLQNTKLKNKEITNKILENTYLSNAIDAFISHTLNLNLSDDTKKALNETKNARALELMPTRAIKSPSISLKDKINQTRINSAVPVTSLESMASNVKKGPDGQVSFTLGTPRPKK